jgi:hypothetical protein
MPQEDGGTQYPCSTALDNALGFRLAALFDQAII